MRTSTLVLALPALAAAQQIPFLDDVKGWFAKASAGIQSAVSSATESVSIPNPVASGAAKFAELKVNKLTLDNHKTLLQPGSPDATPGIENWMIFVTGGNKTCYGLCERAETAWNESVALISAGSTSPPNLALLNCETDGVLCHAWMVTPPSVLYIQLPQPLADQSTPSTTFRSIAVNRTSITAPTIAGLHTQEKYQNAEIYEGFFHPFDGPLAKAGLNIPIGYVIWGFSQVPSWAFMIGVSFLSRSFMSRRMGPSPGAGQRPAGAAAPGGPPAAAT